jgi:hypothetical protein
MVEYRWQNMKQKGTNIPQTAVSILESVLDQARSDHRPDDITVVEKQVNTAMGFCRVAAVISPYGTHFEIGPRLGLNNTITWTFREQDLAEAVTLLTGYLEGNQGDN